MVFRLLPTVMNMPIETTKTDRVQRDRHLLAVFLATSGHSGVDRIMKNLIPAIAGVVTAVGMLIDESFLNGAHEL